MLFGMYAIRDAKSGFLAPTLDQNGDQAMRNFGHAVLTTKDSLFFTHAADFSLWHIADYESDSGLITPLVPPIHLVDADQILKGDKNGREENKENSSY